MNTITTVAFCAAGVLLLWSALAKATLNPVRWVVYWTGTRRRLAVLGVVVLLALIAVVGHSRGAGTAPRRPPTAPGSSTGR